MLSKTLETVLSDFLATNGGDEETCRQYMTAMVERKLSEPLRLPRIVTSGMRDTISWPDQDRTSVSTGCMCDFHGCQEENIDKSVMRADVRRCRLHIDCCTVFGCGATAEFRHPYYRNRCIMHCGGAMECQVVGCGLNARVLSGCCALHEVQLYKRIRRKCTYPDCTQYRLAGGPFQRCRFHGGRWFCKEPRCLQLADDAMYCREHSNLQPIATNSVCSRDDCQTVIDNSPGGGNKTLVLCKKHYREFACPVCATPHSVVAATDHCRHCKLAVKCSCGKLKRKNSKSCQQCHCRRNHVSKTIIKQQS